MPPPPQCATRRPFSTPSDGLRTGALLASSTRVRNTRACLPATAVKAPGYGGATARTRLWMAIALCDQSMIPSSGLRPPQYVLALASCLIRGALPASSAGNARLNANSAATVTLSNTSFAVSSGRIGTACCATMSPLSA